MLNDFQLQGALMHLESAFVVFHQHTERRLGTYDILVGRWELLVYRAQVTLRLRRIVRINVRLIPLQQQLRIVRFNAR